MDNSEIKRLTRELKQRFFMMRNGSTGEQMRRAGLHYSINFGLNLPQIVEIARDFPCDADLARSLWGNVSTRESMLIAPMLFPIDEMTLDEARRWIASAQTVETVDILCHRLLRHIPAVDSLPAAILAEPDSTELERYAAIRLMFNTLTPSTLYAYLPLARAEVGRGGDTATVAAMLADEIEWRLNPDA